MRCDADATHAVWTNIHPGVSGKHDRQEFITVTASSSGPRIRLLPDILVDLEADAERAHQQRLTGRMGGPVTGLAPIDSALGGYLAEGLHILHGAPGTGKTALALQIAATCGAPALFVTAEMPPTELLRRIVARVTGVFLGRLKSGEFAPADVVALARKTIETVPYLAILDATTGPAPSVVDLQTSIESVRNLVARLGTPDAIEAAMMPCLMVIDSGHAWASGLEMAGAPEYDRLNAAIGGLHDLARMMGIPILITAERNRASMVTGGQNAAAGTRTWEYRAETVLDLSPDPDPKVASPIGGERRLILSIHKNRHGPPLPVGPSLDWNGALQRFKAR